MAHSNANGPGLVADPVVVKLLRPGRNKMRRCCGMRWVTSSLPLRSLHQILSRSIRNSGAVCCCGSWPLLDRPDRVLQLKPRGGGRADLGRRRGLARRGRGCFHGGHALLAVRGVDGTSRLRLTENRHAVMRATDWRGQEPKQVICCCGWQACVQGG